MLRLVVQSGEAQGKVLEAHEGTITLGRAASNQLVLNDRHLSGEHASILCEGDRFLFRDNRSTNGSRIKRGDQVLVLNGPDDVPVSLEDGDLLLLGDPQSPVQVSVSVAPPFAAEERGKVVSIKRLA